MALWGHWLDFLKVFAASRVISCLYVTLPFVLVSCCQLSSETWCPTVSSYLLPRQFKVAWHHWVQGGPKPDERQSLWACAVPLCFRLSPLVQPQTAARCLLLNLLFIRTECPQGSAGWMTACHPLSELPRVWPLLVNVTSHQSSVCLWHFWNLIKPFFLSSSFCMSLWHVHPSPLLF